MFRMVVLFRQILAIELIVLNENFVLHEGIVSLRFYSLVIDFDEVNFASLVMFWTIYCLYQNVNLIIKA